MEMHPTSSQQLNDQCELPAGRIILFDAECVLCSANAHFILKHDHNKIFYLASMQGKVGSALFRRHGVDPADPSSILVVDGAVVRKDSDAVISIYEGLGMPWKVAAIFRLFPPFLRDPVYRLVARNRYRIFGRRETCWVPPAQFRARILS
jgi:predicted DCC family thiol-disulfide oxidoreductase YuxK